MKPISKTNSWRWRRLNSSGVFFCFCFAFNIKKKNLITSALCCCCSIAKVMAFGSAWLQANPPGSDGMEDDRWIRLPHTKWNTWLRIGKGLPPYWDMVLVGLIHCRRRSQASFMTPREHRGKAERTKGKLSHSVWNIQISTPLSVNYPGFIFVWINTWCDFSHCFTQVMLRAENF